MKIQRNAGIELLKAGAILLVFLSHVMTVLEFSWRGVPGAFKSLMTNPYYSWFGHGVHVVDFFFVLAGIQAGSFFCQHHKLRPRKVAVLALRTLTPLFLIQLSLSLLGFFSPQGISGPGEFWKFLASITFLSNWLPVKDQWLPVSWFLCLIIQSWLLCFLLRPLFAMRWSAWWLLPLVLMQVLLRGPNAQSVSFAAYLPISFPAQLMSYYEHLYMNPVARFLPFWLGVGLVKWKAQGGALSKLQGKFCLALGFTALAYLMVSANYLPTNEDAKWYLIWQHPISSLAFFLIMAQGLSRSWPCTGSSPWQRLVQTFSSRTLGLYMWQIPALTLAIILEGLILNRLPTLGWVLSVGLMLNLAITRIYETTVLRWSGFQRKT